MSDHQMQGITRIEHNPTGNALIQAAQASQIEPGPKSQEAGAVTKPKAKEKSSAPENKPQPAQSSVADVRLKFSVDPETNDVTVMMVDKTSNKIIRTIPPEELKNLREGGLVELST